MAFNFISAFGSAAMIFNVSASDADIINVYQYASSEPSEYGLVEETLVDGNGNPAVISEPVREDVTVNAGEDLPASYDLRTYNRTTPIKNQSPYGACWAFAAIGCAESDMITDGYISAGAADYSEDHLLWFAGKVSQQGDGRSNSNSVASRKSSFDVGGSCMTATALLSSWSGAELESNAPYAEPHGNYSTSKRCNSYAHLQNAYLLADSNSAVISNMSAIKQYIMYEGAIQMSYFEADVENNGFSGFGTSGASVYSYYQNKKTNSNHAVTIIGWNDDYERTNFNSAMRPSKNGAWLVKNSWGTTSFENNGYIWISYYDTSLQYAFAYDFEPADNYDNIYQYDTFRNNLAVSLIDVTSNKMANIFTANSHESLRAVSVSLPQTNVDYTVKIYKNVSAGSPESGVLQSESTTYGSTSYIGYRTIQLAKPVELYAGEKYSVVVTLATNNNYDVLLPFEGGNVSYTNYDLRFASNEGESFLYKDNSWCDTSKTYYDDGGVSKPMNNACIKAFTNEAGKALSSVAITNAPAKTSYTVGDSLNTTGAVITATYSDGSTENVTSKCTFSALESGSIGIKTITVTYTYDYTVKTASFSVTVSAKETPRISVVQNTYNMTIGDKQSFTVTTNPANQPVELSVVIGSSASASVADNIVTVNALSVGTSSFYVIMTYGGIHYSVPITVNVLNAEVPSKTLSMLTVETQPTQKAYYIGDALNTSGAVITAAYSDGTTADVTSQCTFTGFSSTTAGTKTVTVLYTYEGVSKTTSFSVSVKTPTIAVKPSYVSVIVGGKATLTCTTEPSGSQITWKSGTGAGSYISTSASANTLQVKGLAAGSANVTAEFTYNSVVYRTSVPITVEASVTSPAPIKVTGIAFAEGNSMSIKYNPDGSTVELTPTVYPLNAANKGYTLKSSDTSVATVSASGLVKIHGKGTVVITATSADGGFEATCKIEISYSFVQWLIMILFFGWIWY